MSNLKHREEVNSGHYKRQNEKGKALKYPKPNKRMEKKFVVLATFLVLVFLVAGIYFFTDWFSKVTGYFTGENDVEKLAQCLKEQNAEFYSSQICPDCEKQKELFGQSINYIRVIDCGNEKENCPNILSVPAFYFNSTIVYGYKSLTELDKISGCNVVN